MRVLGSEVLEEEVLDSGNVKSVITLSITREVLFNIWKITILWLSFYVVNVRKISDLYTSCVPHKLNLRNIE